MLKSVCILSVLSLLSLLEGAAAQDRRFGFNNNGNNANQNGNTAVGVGNANANANGNNAANTNTGANNNNNNGDAAFTGLSAQVIQDASNSDGNPSDGEAPSLTNADNFVNFCEGKTLTNGQQLTGGSCNGIVMGDIPSQDNMISSIIINPAVGKLVNPNEPFQVVVQTQNLVAGIFTNPNNTYYAAPQQLQGGKVVGHLHVVIQKMQSFTDTTPPSADTFQFFKGIDDAGNGQGLLTANVTTGLPEGFYRVCTIMGSSNHQPPLMPVAKRGSQEDCTKFQVAATNDNANGNANAASTATGNANTASGTNGNANTASSANGNANTASSANGNANTASSANGNANTATSTNGNANADSGSTDSGNANAANTASTNSGNANTADAGNGNTGDASTGNTNGGNANGGNTNNGDQMRHHHDRNRNDGMDDPNDVQVNGGNTNAQDGSANQRQRFALRRRYAATSNAPVHRARGRAFMV